MSARFPRWRALAAIAVAGTLLLSGCAGAASSGSSASAGSAAGFPVTFDTMYGQTTISSTPQRVATWGWGATDAVLALGVMPVAIPNDTYGAPDTGITPWIQQGLDAVGGPTPTLLDASGDLPVEQLLATNPDVLIAPYSGLTQEEYDAVTAAGVPVVAPAEALWSTPWRDVITDAGKALGLEDKATGVLNDLDAQISAAAAAHPEFQGTSIAFATADTDTIYLYLPADSRVEILENLGFVSAPSVAAMDKGESTFYTTVSPENLDKIDAQVVFSYGFADDAALKTFTSTPPTNLIPAVAKGAVAAIVGITESDAVSPTALTLPYILPTMVDQLAAATKIAKG
jgi:iron complex transport system substrate-binding protein